MSLIAPLWLSLNFVMIDVLVYFLVLVAQLRHRCFFSVFSSIISVCDTFLGQQLELTLVAQNSGYVTAMLGCCSLSRSNCTREWVFVFTVRFNGGMAFMIIGPVMITADVSSGKVLVFGLASVLLEPLRCQNVVNQLCCESFHLVTYASGACRVVLLGGGNLPWVEYICQSESLLHANINSSS